MTLRDYQKELIADIVSAARQHKRVLVQSPTGCHAFGHEILMADGRVQPIQDINAGDYVMGPDSLPRRVVKLHRGEGEMYEILPKGKSGSFCVNLDHVFSFHITPEDQLSGERIESASLRSYLASTKWHRHLRRIRQLPVEFARRGSLVMPPWFLGYLLGDGSLSSSTINLCDEPGPAFDSSIAIAESMGDRVKISKGHGKAHTMSFSGKPQRWGGGNVKRALEFLGLAGKRSREKFIPSEFLIADRSQRLDLLAGLLDSDGHYDGHGYDWISGSRRLAMDFAFLARSLGLCCSLTESWKSCQSFAAPRQYWRASLSGDLSVLNGHSKKYSHQERRQIKNSAVSGFTTKPIGVGRYFGFSLTGDRLYLDAEFRVHHNSGKSVVFADLIRRARDKGRDVLFLVHRRELIYQAQQHLKNVGVDAGIIMAGEEYHPAPVQLASVQTLYRRRDRLDMDRFGLVIIDESHHHGAKTYKEIVNRVNGAHVIGFTATPVRLGGSPLGDVFDTLVLGPKIPDLQALGFLCGTEYMSATMPDMHEVKTSGGDYSEKDLNEKVAPQLIGGVVDHYLSYGGRKGIIFSCGQRHSFYLRDEFACHGRKAIVIDSKTPENERNDLEAEFRAAECGILINCGIFTEGYDLPDCDTLVIARPTKSLGLYLQMAGRGLRPAPGKTLLVIDHGANVFRHGFIEDDHDWNLAKSADKAKIQEAQSERIKKYAACPECGSMVAGPKCHTCGYEITRFERAKNVRELKNCGLKLIDKKDPRKPKILPAATSAGWRSITSYCALKGWPMGAAAHRFKARFGVLPWHANLNVSLPRGSDWKLPAREWVERG